MVVVWRFYCTCPTQLATHISEEKNLQTLRVVKEPPNGFTSLAHSSDAEQAHSSCIFFFRAQLNSVIVLTGLL